MKKTLASLVVVLSFLLLGAAAKPKPATASAQLVAILRDYEKLQLEQDPLARMQQGLAVTQLPDYSYEGDARDAGRLRSFRERLARVDAQKLTHEEWLSREIFDWQLARGIEFHDHFRGFFQITPYSSPLRPLHQVMSLPLFRLQGRQAWARLSSLVGPPCFSLMM